MTAPNPVYAWACCPRCERPLYPHTARRSPDGWVCANRLPCAQHEKAQALAVEMFWFRSFGWSPDRIAQRLGVTTWYVQKRLAEAAA